MVEKARAKKSKTLAKKPAVRSKKREHSEEMDEPLVLGDAPRKSQKSKLLAESQEFEQAQEEGYDEEPSRQVQHEQSQPISQIQPRVVVGKQAAESEYLQVKLSRSLLRKLKEQAADEGISLEEFLSELLSESVTLRAWEIVERKNAMKGGANPNSGGPNRNNNSQPNRNNNNSNNNNGQRGNKGHRGMNHTRYQSIMDDKASFLEYVRSQERNRR